jgi:hypothetical protein
MKRRNDRDPMDLPVAGYLFGNLTERKSPRAKVVYWTANAVQEQRTAGMDGFADERTAPGAETDSDAAEQTSRQTSVGDGGRCIMQSLLARAVPADLIRVMPIAGRHPDEVGGLRRTVMLGEEPGVTLH